MTIFFSIVSLPIVILYLWLFLDTFSEINIDSIWPNKFTLRNWKFLFTTIKGHSNVWPVALNTFIYACSTVIIVVTLSSTAGYALSRLKFPFRAQILGTVLVLHSFP